MNEKGKRVMIILWIRKSPKPAKQDKDLCDPATLAEHNEAMKRFRKDHPDLNIIPAEDIVMADGDLLAPVIGIKLSDNLCN